jgi:beta-N-acetylhexosaminidase
MKNTKVGQLLIIGIAGLELTGDEAQFIVQNNIGGVILFRRNIESPEQLHKLIGSIQSLRTQTADKSPLFISIDMEGGRVHRLNPPFTKWPPLQKVGLANSTTKAFDFAYAMGVEMKSVGINLDFAPSVDIFTNPLNTVIGDRSLSSDPEVVAKLASALIRGYTKANVLACAKHFPGHGHTLVDSHDDLPVEEKTWAELEICELLPFKKAFRSRLDFVMSSHIQFPKVDSDWPVTLSKIFLTDLLRDQLHYRGLVITDDLDMGALIKHFDRKLIPVRALQAGADLLLYCNDPTSPPLALEAIEAALSDQSLSMQKVEQTHQRILQLKKEKLAHPDPWPLAQVKEVVGCPAHLELAQSFQNKP